MDNLLNTSGLSGQQLPNNHFVDPQVIFFLVSRLCKYAFMTVLFCVYVTDIMKFSESGNKAI